MGSCDGDKWANGGMVAAATGAAVASAAIVAPGRSRMSQAVSQCLHSGEHQRRTC
jgi:hypothetical protein